MCCFSLAGWLAGRGFEKGHTDRPIYLAAAPEHSAKTSRMTSCLTTERRLPSSNRRSLTCRSLASQVVGMCMSHRFVGRELNHEHHELPTNLATLSLARSLSRMEEEEEEERV